MADGFHINQYTFKIRCLQEFMMSGFNGLDRKTNLMHFDVYKEVYDENQYCAG
jgi:hypothetical protein